MSDTSKNLAQEALEAVSATGSKENDELQASDKIAETLSALQGVIERNARELQDLDKNMREKREMLKNMIDNNSDISEQELKAKELNAQIKEKKAKIAAAPETVNLKLQIAELSQNKKEVEETLSSHLVNYYQLTGSTSFDTSDGDQWEYNIKARVKAKKA